MFGKWLNTVLNGLKNIHRWEGKQKIGIYDDSSHSFNVALISEGLARIEKEKFNNEVDELLVLRKALFHDVNEVCTGDIISTVKKKTPAMKKALEEVEYKLYKESMEPIIPEEWRNDYENYLLNPKDGYNTIEGRIIGVADNIDALNEAIQEVKLGNKTFIPKLEEIANSILDIDLDSGKHFIKYSLQEFELPMDMYGERVLDFLNTYDI